MPDSNFNLHYEELMVNHVLSKGGHMNAFELLAWMKRCPRRNASEISHTYICSRQLRLCHQSGHSPCITVDLRFEPGGFD